ncbi:hypothetical protein B0T26DRAFT_804171 [Lasiosphaeria miniovina]|uniref:Uncharacterized protein n=1 Tax=Lasiosphaeria miniovina TaxID=1954250 RepID=A0AA40ACF4_9PEZI|nr:uncharacterized protein B0T26DRAFT_804171 [Lasiosphaeria miniovina]KAK0713339.1 hypothetical protein B0T26DRAFT_804171 [Lasiosphaeria miniovina]
MSSYKNPLAEPIAIVGSSCRFAGDVANPHSLWKLLANPADLSREIPPERFNIKAFYHPDAEYHGTTDSPKAYFLDQDHRVFDATFFNITPKEAEAIDPQQRLLLEVVYEALESAGYTLKDYAGADVGVFSGLMTSDYDTLSQRDDLTASKYYATGNSRAVVSNRVSYFFNFNGPSMTIDTACSSSLVALHQAMLSLRSGETGMACVTGVNLIITPEQFVVESNLHMLSPTGHCRMWDAQANGYARGEGVAAVFLKRLSQAIADGDHIEAVIRETGVNSDGRSKGITMPNWEAQARLIKDVYRRAGLDPTVPEDRCQYFEAHGTGTRAGDPNEARAIEEAFFGSNTTLVRPHTATASQKLLVGSVKTVIGHTEGAAGLAGLLKVVQAMEHGSVPPNLHLDKLNADVEQYSSHLQIPTSLVSWPHVHDGLPKRASVNSFGFGGTNAHAIVEQYMPDLHMKVACQFRPNLEAPADIDRPVHCNHPSTVSLPLVLSATSQKSLAAVAREYRDYLRQDPHSHFEAAAWHAYARRTAFPFRHAVSGGSTAEVADKLDKIVASSAKNASVALGVRARPEDEQPRILGIFTGQGAQWATMSRGLLRTSQVFAMTIRSMDNVLQNCPHPPSWSLEQEILADQDLSRVSVAAISQPLCTAVQVGLVNIMRTLDIHFHTVVGHSSGEIGAAYAAGKITSREAILIAYYRGLTASLAQSSRGVKGAMLATSMTKEEAAELCANKSYCHGVCLAASNAPSSVTLSGDIDMVELVHKGLTAQSKFARLLQVDTAYHSPHMDAPAAKYVEYLRACSVEPTKDHVHAKWVSSVYGCGQPGDEELRADYWCDNMTKPVLFYEAVGTALELHGPFDCVVEIGPHPALRGPVTQTFEAKTGGTVPYFSPLARGTDDRVAFAEFLGKMWSHFDSSHDQIRGFVLGSVSQNLANKRHDGIPRYPWDHSQIHYRESRISRQFHFKTDPPHELLGSRTRDDNDHELRWRNILKLEKLPWIQGHRFQGQALLPASAYIVMAKDAAQAALAGRTVSSIELRDLKFPSGIILEPDSPGIETLFSLTVERTDRSEPTVEASFTLTSAVADGNIAMKKNFSGTLLVTLGDATLHSLPTRPAKQPETLSANPAAFYTMMAETGLDYTGPFQGLAKLDRRYDFASASLLKYHPADTTKLSISPATLDSCLQTAFVCVSSPGDRAIWTSFLPERIERIRFNLATCDVQSPSQMLGVDAYLTHATPITAQSAASFTVDIEIYDQNGHMETQVEGLTVGSFSPTKPEDDYELYLTTITDIDPDDEIITATLDDIHAPAPMLAESCERVASLYINNMERLCSPRMASHMPFGAMHGQSLLSLASWPADNSESVDKFIKASPYFSSLDFIRRLGRILPDVLSGMLPTIVEEAHQLRGFQLHVARVVQQIAHKYPRMNVLGLTEPDLGLTAHILNGLEEAFLTLHIGADAEPNLEHLVSISNSTRQKIMIDKVDLDLAEEANDATRLPYDLVVVSTSLIKPSNSRDVLRRIRRMMCDGGFLMLLDISRSPLQERIRLVAGVKPDDSDSGREVLDWADALDLCGFKDLIKGSYQHYPPGFTLHVRQAESHKKQQLLHPFAHAAHQRLTDKLLIVGGKHLWTSLIVTGVGQALEQRCGSITSAEKLEDMHIHSALEYSAVILLSDIDEPVLATMTEARMDVLKALLRPRMVILWMVHHARIHNPDHAASFGFARTLVAETPNLKLQMLNLETIDTVPAVNAVSESFASLALQSLVDEADSSRPLWVFEPEIHLEKGHRLVPRIKPWEAANERVNASRRIVSNTVNSLETIVEILPTGAKHGAAQYGTKVQDIIGALPHLASGAGESTIQVDYSTAEPLNVGWGHSAHVCLGRDTTTLQTVVALSKSNASFITVPSKSTSIVPSSSRHGDVDPLKFFAFLPRYLTALTIATVANTKKSVLVLEPDLMFQECVKDVLVNRGIWFRVASMDSHRSHTIPGTVFMHPASCKRQIKAIYPPTPTLVFDLLSESSELAKKLLDVLPATSEYVARSALLGSKNPNFQHKDDAALTENIWNEAFSLSLAKSSDWKPEFANVLSVPDVLEALEPTIPFQIVDWKAERSVSHIVKPHDPNTRRLSPNKTYLLVGLTRDFGQSLCTLLVAQGAQNIVLSSRNPPKEQPQWQTEMLAQGINIRFETLDVTNAAQVMGLKAKLAATGMPPVGGVVNGAMVLEDRVFSMMSLSTLQRVMAPKTIGSKNLDVAFDSPDVDFFIMTSSFAGVGGHAGQSNYAAANMYMNGLVALRHERGLAASVLNIGVIYGLGFLHREKGNLYMGLEREGYPPISERDIHHMFIEAMDASHAATAPVAAITTGLSRFSMNKPTLSWHRDSRFSHYTLAEGDGASVGRDTSGSGLQSLLEKVAAASTVLDIYNVLVPTFAKYLEGLLHIPADGVAHDSTISELGADSLVAVEIRSWLWKNVARDVAVMKLLGSITIAKLCHEMAAGIFDARKKNNQPSNSDRSSKPMPHSLAIGLDGAVPSRPLSSSTGTGLSPRTPATDGLNGSATPSTSVFSNAELEAPEPLDL